MDCRWERTSYLLFYMSSSSSIISLVFDAQLSTLISTFRAAMNTHHCARSLSLCSAPSFLIRHAVMTRLERAAPDTAATVRMYARARVCVCVELNTCA
jgi:hypothetical protein